MTRGCKVPSKYTSLSVLLDIQANDYLGKDGTNYESYYIDELINIKLGNNADKTNKKLIKDLGNNYSSDRISDDEAMQLLLNSIN